MAEKLDLLTDGGHTGISIKLRRVQRRFLVVTEGLVKLGNLLKLSYFDLVGALTER